MCSSIEINLGQGSELAALFSYAPGSDIELRAWIAHSLNQTMLRDLFYGSWVDVWGGGDENEPYGAKITSPSGDVSAYRSLIPAFLDAGRIALNTYRQNQSAITAAGLHFMLPFGLCMARTRSIQLLHFPPLEARTYMDYLYSPTNRRWESLLGYAGYDGSRNTLVERVTDVVPLAAPGGDSTGIEPFNQIFIAYGKAMLRAGLDARASTTQPVVAYGAPVRRWLENAFADQISQELDVLSLVELAIVDGPTTPVLCANHPSDFLEQPDKGVLFEDLVAASWQSQMAVDWEADPAEALTRARSTWDERRADVDAIYDAQVREFSWSH
jgi:hypothetical protein